MKTKGIVLGLIALALTAFTACSIFVEESSSTSQSSESAFSSAVEGESLEKESLEKESLEKESAVESGSDRFSADEEDVYYTVQFDTDGGGEISPVSVKKGEKILKPETPNKANKNCEYVFLGWYYGDTEWDFESDVVTQDMTLVARWEEGESYTDPFLPKN